MFIVCVVFDEVGESFRDDGESQDSVHSLANRHDELEQYRCQNLTRSVAKHDSTVTIPTGHPRRLRAYQTG